MNERISGVYLIRCIPTGKIYVGSSGNIRIRWGIHRSQLTKGIHRNTYLQAAWDKHGANAFVWNVIEVAKEERLIEREQHFIDSLRASDRKHGFNLRVVAHSNRGMKMPEGTGAKTAAARKGKPLSVQARANQEAARQRRTPEQRADAAEKAAQKRRGQKRSPETRRKMSEAKRNSPATLAHVKNMAQANKGKPLSEEHKANISAARKGCTRTPEHRAKLSAANMGKPLSAEHRAKIAAGCRHRRTQKRRQTPWRQQEFDF